VRLAVLADVHGNLPALEHVLEDAERLGAQSVIVAGDLTGGPQPVETISRLRQWGATMIRGNSDENLLRFRRGHAPAEWSSSLQFALLRWTHNRLDAQTYDFLESLPLERSVHIPTASSLRVVHGSPGNPYEGLSPDEDLPALDSALGAIDENVLICGHSHKPWMIERSGRLALNPGAVCGPLNGDTAAQYALLEWDGNAWHADHRSVPYDLELIRDAFCSTGLLLEGGVLARCFLASIVSGRDIASDFLDHARHLAAAAGFSSPETIPDDVWLRASDSFAW
jgi:putative phosphoesterase